MCAGKTRADYILEKTSYQEMKMKEQNKIDQNQQHMKVDETGGL